MKAMKTIMTLGFFLVFTLMTTAHAQQETSKKDDVKALSGMSIVGNDDAPKALYIVPWKSSEVGIEVTPDRPDAKGYAPVDPVVFKRKIDYYYVSTTKDTGR